MAVTLVGCATAPMRDGGPSRRDAANPPAFSPAQTITPTLRQLADEAGAMQAITQSSLGKRFLDVVRALPEIGQRTIYINPVSREYFSAEAKASLPAATRATLTPVEIDESRYYYTKYGSPLAYVRLLDLAAAHGINDVNGMRILDFGYGSVGHLRLLASLGAHVTGIDPDSYLAALYSQSRDQGAVPPVGGTRRGHPGTIALAHGYWPKDPRIVERVGKGYDLILSKNTLKKGYVKPERKIDKRQQIELGVSDDAFLKTLFSTLNPGGKMIIYNLYPRPPGPKEKYNPQADARSPWPREQWEKAGFNVLAFNVEDHAAARNMGRALKWDRDQNGDAVNLDASLFAMLTILERPGR